MDDEKIFLPDAVQIDMDGISHFSSNEHAGMNDELFILVAKAGEELLLLPKGLMARWEAAIKAEMGHVKGRRGSELTKQLRELDRDRVKMHDPWEPPFADRGATESVRTADPETGAI